MPLPAASPLDLLNLAANKPIHGDSVETEKSKIMVSSVIVIE